MLLERGMPHIGMSLKANKGRAGPGTAWQEQEQIGSTRACCWPFSESQSRSRVPAGWLQETDWLKLFVVV